jgi:type IV secretory pathway VirB6-like protein
MKIDGLISVVCIAMLMWIFMFTFIKIRENAFDKSAFKVVAVAQAMLSRSR